ncbi:MAG TPA: tetratricopeptide repeat protein [Stellaceae bacterium]|nr:tetratricopeptide repeat protein [Stellaceae bacterium]
MINNYGNVVPSVVAREELEAGLALLVSLPTNTVPGASPLPLHSRMPLSRNPLFVGRDQDLQQTARTIKTGEAAAVAAMTGLGGIGKTQLASEFVHRYGQFFAGGVFWLNFAKAEDVPGEVARCGGAAGLALRDNFDELAEAVQIDLVLAAWSSLLPRLLIFDNCEDEGLLCRWRPTTGGARVLLTSRRAVWPPALGVQPLPLGVLSRGASVALLRKHRPDLSEDDPDLAAIAEELGYLPLALHLAGSYLQKYRHSPIGRPVTYLAELRRPDLLDHLSLVGGDYSPTGHERHVANTFGLSFDKLAPADATDALARAALFRAACFALGEPIPRELLKASLGYDLNDGAAARLAEDALSRAVQLGLIDQQASGDLTLHRLLAAYLKRVAGDEQAIAQDAVEQAVGKAAQGLNAAGYPAPLTAWRPHLRAITDAADGRSSRHAAVLLAARGHHLRMIADFASARVAYERALSITEKAFGPDHPHVAANVSHLGTVLHDLGDFAGARAAYERALAIDEKAFGPGHPEVARVLSTLGTVLRDLGDFAGARAAHERALAIDEKVFGPDHPDIATIVSNLGLVLEDLGDLVAARAAYERALAIDEEAFGPDHFTVAIRANNLGSVLGDLGDLAGARAAYERALAIDEKTFGPDHPNVARDANNLGGVRWRLGDLAGARAAYELALAIAEKAFGPGHPTVVTITNNLGGLLGDLGDRLPLVRSPDNAKRL